MRYHLAGWATSRQLLAGLFETLLKNKMRSRSENAITTNTVTCNEGILTLISPFCESHTSVRSLPSNLYKAIPRSAQISFTSHCWAQP